MRQDNGGEGGLLEGLVEMLNREAEVPPREVRGVSDEWLTGKFEVSGSVFCESGLGGGWLCDGGISNRRRDGTRGDGGDRAC